MIGGTRNQIYEGTKGTYTNDGVGDGMQVRALVVINTTETSEAIDGAKAIRAAVNKYFFVDETNEDRLFSPGHDLLPLRRVSGKQIARNLVELQIEYGGRGTVGNGSVLAQFEMVQMPTVVFTKSLSDESADGASPTFVKGLPFEEYLDGLPITKVLPPVQIRQLRTVQFNRAAMRISIRKSEFGINPMIKYAGNIKTVNQSAQSVAGFVCQPGTLLLDGLRSSATTIGTIDPSGQTPPELLRYDYDLTLVYNEHGFPIQGFREATVTETSADPTLPETSPVDADPSTVFSKIIDITSEFEQSDWRI
jgi:hypothetical protein